MSAIDDASKRQESARREALDALARGGTAGVDAYKQAQTSVQGYQQTALNQALNSAAGRGANTAAQGQLESIIRMPGDRTLQNLAASQGSYEADMARRATANSDYFAQAAAAVPAIQAATARDKSYIQQQAAAQAKKESDAKWQQEALARGLAEIQAEADRAKRQNDIVEQQQRVAQQTRNPTFDPVGAALQLGSGMPITPEERAHAEQVIANPSAGARYITRGGQEVDATPTLADPHYMGHQLTDNADALAREIALAQVPADVQAQRNAYLSIYGDDPRNQALARGIFQPPSVYEVGQDMLDQARQQQALDFYSGTGLVGTPTQTQRYAMGEDPFAPAGGGREVLTPEEAASAAGVSPEEVASLRNLPAFNAALVAFENGRKGAFSLAETDRTLREVLEEEYGHDYPKVRALVSAMYSNAFRG